jgi:outer membrane protein assembly factor BamB
MLKHAVSLVAFTSLLAGLANALDQKPAKARDSSPAGPVEVHVTEDLIPRQQPRSDDWPMHGYDAGNTFCNQDEKTLAPPLVKVWDVTLEGHLDSVVVSSGIVLAAAGTDQKHKVFALDARNGRRLWTFTLPGGGGGAIGMSPACSGDLVFFGGQNDKSVYATDLRTGALRWKHDEIKSMYDASPKVADGVLYINSTQSGLWAFDAKTGEVKWRDRAPGWQADIAIKAGKLLRPGGAYGGALIAFDSASGEQSWRHDGRSTSFRLATTDKLTFVTYAGENPVEITVGKDYKRFKYDRIAAFGTRDGKKVWETVLEEDAHYSGLLLAGDSLYAATREGSVYRLDTRTGKIRKEVPLKDGLGSLIGAKEVIFASSREAIVALAPNTLETLWKTRIVGFPHMAVANGRLYVAADSRIVAFANVKRDGKEKPD